MTINYAEILVVDDMPDHIAYSGTILRAEGYRVFATTSGKATFKFLEKKIPDLILLDIQMDDIDGLTLCRMLKENARTRDIPVIFLTAETSPETIQQGFALGCCDYVKKPFIKEEYLARVRTHLQISTQQKELAAANNELNLFCSAVSHDLKAPFNIINMLIEMLSQELNDIQNDDISNIMNMIISKSTQTKTMIERLFEFSKMCNITPRMTMVNIKEIIQTTFSELHELSPDRNIEFRCGDLPEVKGDPVLLQAVVKNLLANAIKYTSKKEKAVIEVSGHVTQNNRIIKIKDNGSGFDMAYANKLFQVFQRLHSEEEFEGSGVGLALVSRIMKRHNGEVKAYGETGKGAEFSLIFIN
ncbi:MAG: response regulator [Ruminococcus flavefaciens]|nr:response regulator [Ruminococcus flavefaciens]